MTTVELVGTGKHYIPEGYIPRVSGITLIPTGELHKCSVCEFFGYKYEKLDDSWICGLCLIKSAKGEDEGEFSPGFICNDPLNCSCKELGMLVGERDIWVRMDCRKREVDRKVERTDGVIWK